MNTFNIDHKFMILSTEIYFFGSGILNMMTPFCICQLEFT